MRHDIEKTDFLKSKTLILAQEFTQPIPQGIKMNLCICAVILYNLQNHISNIYVTP